MGTICVLPSAGTEAMIAKPLAPEDRHEAPVLLPSSSYHSQIILHT